MTGKSMGSDPGRYVGDDADLPEVLCTGEVRDVSADEAGVEVIVRLDPNSDCPSRGARVALVVAGEPESTPAAERYVAAKEPQCGDPYHRHTGSCHLYDTQRHPRAADTQEEAHDAG